MKKELIKFSYMLDLTVILKHIIISTLKEFITYLTYKIKNEYEYEL